MADALGDGERYFVRIELERVVVTVGQEGRADETWSYIMQMDVADASDAAKLGEALHIVVNVALGGGIGWGGAESACASDAADDSKMPFLVGMILEVVEGCIHHLRESHHIRCNSRHLFVLIKSRILIAYACTMEIEIHSSCLANQCEQTTRCVLLGDVDAFRSYHIQVLTLNLLQSLLSTPSDAHLPPLCGQHLDQFQPDARCRTDDNRSFLCHTFNNLSAKVQKKSNSLELLP